MIYTLLFRLGAALTKPPGLPTAEPSSITIKWVLNFAFGLAGAIALLIILIAGFRFSLSRGNPDSINNAKNSIIYAVVGLVVAMFGVAIVNFVFSRVN